MLPLALSIIPFALLTGIAGVKVGMPAGTAFVFSILVYAGASQLVAYQLIASGTPILLVLLSCAMVNLRFMMYSATVAPFLSKLSLRMRTLYAYLMTDQVVALSIQHFTENTDDAIEKPHQHWFYAGTGVLMVTVWQAAVAVGIFVGTSIPPEWGLEFSIPLSFLALVMPTLKDRPIVLAALASGITAAITGNFPYRTGLMISALVGVTVGLVAETVRDQRAQKPEVQA
jgi:predicted branched-subunit amino acid permease